MRPQKHSGLILSWTLAANKRVGLHYIGFLKIRRAGKALASLITPKIRPISQAATNFG
jgi:hypothetical protein